MGAVFALIQADGRNPFIDQTSILPCAEVAEVVHAAGKEKIMNVAAASRQPCRQALSGFRHDFKLACEIDTGNRLAAWLWPFADLFTRPTWQRVLVLMTGAILTPHRRTVSAALRATGRDHAADFGRYHAVLNRSRWSALAAAYFAKSNPLVPAH
jgi:hypothetical protein